jgi:hypothetical protein
MVSVGYKSISRRLVLAGAFACVAAGQSAANVNALKASDLKIGPEHFLLTMQETTGSVMVDLHPFKAQLSAVPAADRPALIDSLGRRVGGLVFEELEAADARKLRELTVNLVYVTQRDEYNRPRAGGLQQLGAVQLSLGDGKITNAVASGAFPF